MNYFILNTMQRHKDTKTQNNFNFLEKKVVFNDTQKQNYPQECRNVNWNQAQSDYQQQALYNINNTITQAQKNVLRCQDALASAFWAKITQEQGLINGAESYILTGAVTRGALSITKVIIYIPLFPDKKALKRLFYLSSQGFLLIGSTIEKILHFQNILSTQTSPHIPLAISLQIESPSPVPFSVLFK